MFLYSLSALTADGISLTLVYVYNSVLTLKKVRRGEVRESTPDDRTALGNPEYVTLLRLHGYGI